MATCPAVEHHIQRSTLLVWTPCWPRRRAHGPLSHTRLISGHAALGQRGWDGAGWMPLQTPRPPTGHPSPQTPADSTLLCSTILCWPWPVLSVSGAAVFLLGCRCESTSLPLQDGSLFGTPGAWCQSWLVWAGTGYSWWCGWPVRACALGHCVSYSPSSLLTTCWRHWGHFSPLFIPSYSLPHVGWS